MKDTKKLRFSAYLADACTSDFFTGVSSMDGKEREVLAVPVYPRMRYGELLNACEEEFYQIWDWLEDLNAEEKEVITALKECFVGTDLRTTFEPSEDLEDGEDMETLYAYFVVTFEG